MPSLKSIRRRIGSVKNTQKITRAMKMVAAARLRRAQQNILDLRPYAIKTLEVLSSVATRAAHQEGEIHPLLQVREERNVLLLVLTSDRGLAGAFNTNINKAALRMLKKLEGEGKTVRVAIVGRKGREYFSRRGANITHVFSGVFENLTLEKAREIAAALIDEYVKKDLDAIYVAYNEFKSAISQKVVIERLLPIQTIAETHGEDVAAAEVDFIYEPNKTALLDTLLPMYAEVEIFRALLESVASEHGARMTAMDNATRNAKDLIGRLTLQYNRARQAAITKELMEIIGGAEALKG